MWRLAWALLHHVAICRTGLWVCVFLLWYINSRSYFTNISGFLQLPTSQGWFCPWTYLYQVYIPNLDNLQGCFRFHDCPTHYVQILANLFLLGRYVWYSGEWFNFVCVYVLTGITWYTLQLKYFSLFHCLRINRLKVYLSVCTSIVSKHTPLPFVSSWWPNRGQNIPCIKDALFTEA